MIADWFHSREALIAELDDERNSHSRTQRRLAVLRSVIHRLEADVKALRLVVACTDPMTHTRLAHRAQVAETLLAQRDGRDPHLASLRPVPFDPAGESV